MKERRKARELALEALYRFEITKEEPNTILKDIFARVHPTREIKEFTRMLVSRTIEETEKINKIISKIAKNWKLDRMAIIDRNILKSAVCEILFFSDIPYKVSIDEAIELAKKYSTEDSGRFVNGILDRVVKEWC
jgi:N utilization substance protein B